MQKEQGDNQKESDVFDAPAKEQEQAFEFSGDKSSFAEPACRQGRTPADKYEYISLAEAAGYTRFSQDYISLLVRNRKITGQKFGRNWKVRMVDIEQYIARVETKKIQRETEKELEAVSPVKRGVAKIINNISALSKTPDILLPNRPLTNFARHKLQTLMASFLIITTISFSCFFWASPVSASRAEEKFRQAIAAAVAGIADGAAAVKQKSASVLSAGIRSAGRALAQTNEVYDRDDSNFSGQLKKAGARAVIGAGEFGEFLSKNVERLEDRAGRRQEYVFGLAEGAVKEIINNADNISGDLALAVRQTFSAPLKIMPAPIRYALNSGADRGSRLLVRGAEVADQYKDQLVGESRGSVAGASESRQDKEGEKFLKRLLSFLNNTAQGQKELAGKVRDGSNRALRNFAGHQRSIGTALLDSALGATRRLQNYVARKIDSGQRVLGVKISGAGESQSTTSIWNAVGGSLVTVNNSLDYAKGAWQVEEAESKESLATLWQKALDFVLPDALKQKIAGQLETPVVTEIIREGQPATIIVTSGTATSTRIASASAVLPRALELDRIIGSPSVSGSLTVGDNLIVEDDFTLKGDLGVSGSSAFYGPVDFQAAIFSSAGDLIVNDDLTIYGAAAMNALNVSGPATVSGQLTAQSLTVSNNANIGGTLAISGQFLANNINATSFVSAGLALSSGGSLSVAKDGSIGEDLTVKESLTVGGASTFSGAVTINNNLDLNGGLDVSSNAVIGGNLNVSGTSTVGSIASTGQVSITANTDDYALLVNQQGAGNIFQLRDGGADVFTVADSASTTANFMMTIAGSIGPDATDTYSLGKVNWASSIDAANANMIINGIADNDYFGRSVFSIGDYNADGYDDILVTASQADESGTDRGRAYVFLGSSTPAALFDAANADIIINGTADSDFLGEMAHTAGGAGGDINGDGYDDFIIGAYLAEDAGTNRGRAYIFYGSSTPASVIDAENANVIINGTSDNDEFGYSVSSAGDLNGDGYDDVIIGAGKASATGTERGRAYIILGSGSLSSSLDAENADMILNGVSDDYGRFGYAVSAAGDYNKDGYDDIIVGAYQAEDAGTNRGRAYIFNGSSTPASAIDADNANIIINGAVDVDNFGLAVAGAGDLNGDGYDDVIVGAPSAEDAGTARGLAYVFYGSSTPASMIDAENANVIINGTADSDYFGWNIAPAGDLNADGYSDVLISAYLADESGTDRGRVYIFYGSKSLSSSINAENADVILDGAADSDSFGSAIAGNFDFDGNGYDDIVVGTNLADESGTDRGRAYLFLGDEIQFNNIRTRYVHAGDKLTIGDLSLTKEKITARGQLFIDTNKLSLFGGLDVRGNIGVGTTSPTVSFAIDATDAMVIPVGTTAQRPGAGYTGMLRYNISNTTFEGYNGTNWTGLGGVIDVDQDTYIIAESSSGADEDVLFFHTAGNEQMRLTSDGYLGIGTTSPSAMLTVWATSTPGVPLINALDTASSTLFGVFDSGNVGIGTSSPSALLSLSTSTVPQLRIAYNDSLYSDIYTDSSGHLNIDSAAGDIWLRDNIVPVPGSTHTVGSATNYWTHGYFDELTVNVLGVASTTVSGTLTSSFTINSDAADDEDSSLIFYRGAAGLPNATLNWDADNDRFELGTVTTPFELYAYGNLTVATTTATSTISTGGFTVGTSHFVVTSGGGDIGIGTTTPNSILNIYGAAPKITLSDSSAGIDLKHWYLQSTGGSLYLATTSDSLIDTAAPALMVNSSGYVGIGTTSPGRLLHIAGGGGGTMILDDSGGAADDMLMEFDMDGGALAVRSLKDDLTTNIDSILVLDNGNGNVRAGNFFEVGDENNDSNKTVYIDRSFTATANGFGIANTGAITGAANSDLYGAYFANNFVEAAAGTHALFAQGYFASSTIAAGVADLTDAVTLYVAGAPSGAANNYGLYVAPSAGYSAPVLITDSSNNVGIASTSPNWIFSINDAGNGFAVNSSGNIVQGGYQG
ncbi:hypothetical protein COT99_04040, partial [Candidatus Falkowbacteria bacterium CG10_big_fil_rev_8_21_14_0_10_43_10]